MSADGRCWVVLKVEESGDEAMSSTVLVGKTVLVGPVGCSVQDGAVRIRDGRIDAVGPGPEVLASSPESEVKHFPGATLLPGLIDAHTHLVLDGGPGASQRFAAPARGGSGGDDEALLGQMRIRAAHALQTGVTTMRDVGDARGLARRLRDEPSLDIPLPRILTAGSALTIRDGEAAFLGGAVEPQGGLRAAVRSRVAEGADFISIMGSGGLLGLAGPAVYEPQFSLSEICEAVDEAHAAGVRVVVHAHAAEAIARAVQAGADEVDHMTGVTRERDIIRDEVSARQMADQGIAACVIHSANWRRVVAGSSHKMWDKMYGKLPWLAKVGVPLIAGSRAGTANALFSNFVDGLEAYTWAGLSAESVIESVTSRSAKHLGLAEVTGRLKVGLAGDVLVVDGDPREDIGALRKVQYVLSAGRPVGTAATC